MDKNSETSDASTSGDASESGEQSFVGKLKTSVTGIISHTPLSKWFGKQNTTTNSSTIRRREEDPDEDFYDLQPPTKRTKLPSEKERLNIDINDTLPSPISSVTNLNRINFGQFPEPIAGPSSFGALGAHRNTRKVLNSTSILLKDSFKNGDILNNDMSSKVDSDSEASTSGYSSGQLASKAVSQESSKQPSPQDTCSFKTRSLFSNSNAGRNLFSERGISPNPNSSSSRGPSFIESFGSPNFVDRTLSTKRILNSPFYSGRTIYGGASSSYGRNSGRTNQDLRRALKNSIQIKPVNKDTSGEKSDLQLGKTARRILDTLEQYSSPVIDAKKIPLSPKKPRDGFISKYTCANPYTLLREHRTASNRELQVPSVTDLLKMKQNQQKSKLQDTTEAVRQIAKKAKTNQNKLDISYRVPQAQDQEKLTGKIKTKITAVRQKPQSEETLPELKLNPVALPIKEMPKFDIVIPPPSQPSKTLLEAPVSSVKSKGSESDKIISITGQFKFSAPLELGKCEHPIKAVNNFKFSEPLVKKRKSIHPELDAKNSTTKNNGEHLLKSSPATSDVSLMQKFKPAQGMWECSMCMIRNQPDKVKCVACETIKPDDSSTKDTETSTLPSFSFGDKFKPASDTWECPSCMIRNNENLSKCVACDTTKPGTQASLFKAGVSPATKGGSSGFGAQFAPSASTWECPTCMIRNKGADIKCVACETLKPGAKPSTQTGSKTATNSFTFGVPATSTFGNKFAPPANTWECSSCMIRNKDDDSKCVACETTKPGAPVTAQSGSKLVSNSFSFGVSSAASGFGNKFAPPPSSWECPACMIRNKDEVEKCVACETCRPGGSKVLDRNSGTGLKKEDQWECGTCMVRNKSTLNKCPCCESPKPGTNLSSSVGADIDKDKKISGFSFGVDKATASSFTFGVPASMQQSSTPNNASSSFSFGVSAASSAKTTTPSFSFGVTATKYTKPNNDSLCNRDLKKEENKPTIPKITFGGQAAIKADTSTNVKKADEKPKSEDKLDSSVKVNPLLKPSEKLPEKAKPAVAGFSFGLTASTTTKSTSKVDESEESPAKRKAPSTTSTTESPKVPLFNFKPPTTNGDVNKVSPFAPKTNKEDNKSSASAGFQFSFGSNKTTDPNVAPVPTDSAKGAVFKFGPSGVTDERKATPPAPNGFNFSSNKTPSFGASVPTTNNASSETTKFGFGAGAPTSLTTESAKAPNFSFGSTVQPQEPAKAPTFSFTAASSTSDKKSSATPNFSFGGSIAGSAEPAKPAVFAFGTSTTKPSPVGFGQSATPAFGQAASNIASSTTPAFGQSAQSSTPSFGQPAPSLNSSFGQSAPGSNLFGHPAAASNASPFGAATAASGGGFGQSTSQVTNPFAQSNSTTVPQAPPFGQSTTAPTFNFGGSSNSSTAPKDTPFGGASTQPANGLFNFGSGAQTGGTNTSAGQRTGFSFGSSNTTASQGGFNFGSAAAAPTASGGFNFSGSAPSFDSTAKPSFNFTGGAGVQQFSATPSAADQTQAPGARRIRKGIRRSQVR